MTIARRLCLSLPLAALAAPAFAHSGVDAGAHHGFLAGVAHPFTGADHLLAILAVGLVAGVALRRAWLAPAAFLAAMLAGALLVDAGIAIPAVEPMIAASLLVFGLAVAARARLAPIAAAGPAALFALFHGAAHAIEFAGNSTAPLAGMLAGSALLLAAGAGLGAAARARGSVWWPRAAGIATTLLGAALLASMAARG